MKSSAPGMDFQQIKRQWESRGFSCALWTDPPGQVWKDFIHETDELVLLVEGQIEVEMNGEAHRPAVGEEVYIPAGTLHTVRNAGPTVSHWYYGYALEYAHTD
ncbi:MAG: hypothetical protein AMXMBFR84_09010 [Candidatus Hydrogenedentota bacterium]